MSNCEQRSRPRSKHRVRFPSGYLENGKVLKKEATTCDLAVSEVVSFSEQRVLHLAEEELEDVGAVVCREDSGSEVTLEVVPTADLLSQGLLSSQVTTLSEESLLIHVCQRQIRCLSFILTCRGGKAGSSWTVTHFSTKLNIHAHTYTYAYI